MTWKGSKDLTEVEVKVLAILAKGKAQQPPPHPHLRRLTKFLNFVPNYGVSSKELKK